MMVGRRQRRLDRVLGSFRSKKRGWKRVKKEEERVKEREKERDLKKEGGRNLLW